MTQTDIILKTHNICKSYGTIEALKNINLQLEDKKIYGLFGRNGAGKTTFLNIITSRIFADSGNVTYLGQDIFENPGIITGDSCYMPEKHYFPARFRVRELLSLGKMSFPNFDKPYADKLCRIFKLNTSQKYGELSRGYQSIFRIVLGLAANTALTIFDEPVLGLDAVSRDQFYSELIEQFSENPRLFIISTHLIEESADLFNEAIIIKDGEIIRHTSVEELLSHAFYVSGLKIRVDEFVKNRRVIGSQTVNNMKMAVVEGNLNDEEPSSGLQFFPLTIQKLFIHLTNDNGNRS